jgi:hypothetical protein
VSRVPRKCDSQLSNRLTERERDRQKCDYSSHAYAIAAAPNHSLRFWARAASDAHAGQAGESNIKFSFAPCFAGIAISLCATLP